MKSKKHFDEKFLPECFTIWNENFSEHTAIKYPAGIQLRGSESGTVFEMSRAISHKAGDER
ncbi:hypothetical protein GACE_1648 [Geoglobus acetivorans]|uniref:Uncharacterized protein n=1 Tax=Geoglobus acetivorans TaxID=565033 RepID=A0A0A7GF73_GEOAI|nr:hypothetical protein GACE_1648 [Geoglobus acetivorans]